MILKSALEAQLLRENPELFGRIQVTWSFRNWVPRWAARLIARYCLISTCAYTS